MCFGSKPSKSAPPAPAPPPPEPLAEETPVTEARRTEDKELFGAKGPSLRVDRSTTSGGVGAGGAGLKM